MSSPRETGTSLRRASAESASSSAAALLFTTSASSAPVSAMSIVSARVVRLPRLPDSLSSSMST